MRRRRNSRRKSMAFMFVQSRSSRSALETGRRNESSNDGLSLCIDPSRDSIGRPFISRRGRRSRRAANTAARNQVPSDRWADHRRVGNSYPARLSLIDFFVTGPFIERRVLSTSQQARNIATFCVSISIFQRDSPDFPVPVDFSTASADGRQTLHVKLAVNFSPEMPVRSKLHLI